MLKIRYCGSFNFIFLFQNNFIIAITLAFYVHFTIKLILFFNWWYIFIKKRTYEFAVSNCTIKVTLREKYYYYT